MSPNSGPTITHTNLWSKITISIEWLSLYNHNFLRAAVNTKDILVTITFIITITITGCKINNDIYTTITITITVIIIVNIVSVVIIQEDLKKVNIPSLAPFGPGSLGFPLYTKYIK